MCVLLDSLEEPLFLMFVRFLLYTSKRRNEILFIRNPDDIDTTNWILRITEWKKTTGNTDQSGVAGDDQLGESAGRVHLRIR